MRVETRFVAANGRAFSSAEACLAYEGASPRGSSPWLPIETAPSNTFVLVAGLSGYGSTPLRVEVCRRVGDDWRNHAHDLFTDGGDEPLYWLPLPPLK